MISGRRHGCLIFKKGIIWWSEHHKLRTIQSSYIQEKANISMADITGQLTPQQSRWINSTTGISLNVNETGIIDISLYES